MGLATFQEQRGSMATAKSNYTAVEVNGLTGETTERELTAEEIAELPPRLKNETPIPN